MRCSICDERIKKIEAYLGDRGTLYENRPLCESCFYEDEPAPTVFYRGDDQPYVIMGPEMRPMEISLLNGEAQITVEVTTKPRATSTVW